MAELYKHVQEERGTRAGAILQGLAVNVQTMKKMLDHVNSGGETYQTESGDKKNSMQLYIRP